MATSTVIASILSCIKIFLAKIDQKMLKFWNTRNKCLVQIWLDFMKIVGSSLSNNADNNDERRLNYSNPQLTTTFLASALLQ